MNRFEVGPRLARLIGFSILVLTYGAFLITLALTK